MSEDKMTSIVLGQLTYTGEPKSINGDGFVHVEVESPCFVVGQMDLGQEEWAALVAVTEVIKVARELAHGSCEFDELLAARSKLRDSLAALDAIGVRR